MGKAGVLAAAVAFASGCAGVSSKPVVEFPSQAQLDALEGNPVTLPVYRTGEVPREGWSVEQATAPADAGDDLWLPRGAWEQAFASAYSAVGDGSSLTRAMACAARELGRFTLEKQAPPPEPLRQFMAAACGVFAPSVGLQFLQRAVSEDAGDDPLLGDAKEQILSALVAGLPPDARYVGFWFGRQGDRAVALAAFDATPVQLKPLSAVPDANGELTIEGRLDVDAVYVDGFANQGRFGVADCLVDPSVQRPEFRVTCRMAPGDDLAWMEVVYAPPRSVLAVPIVQVLAR